MTPGAGIAPPLLGSGQTLRTGYEDLRREALARGVGSSNLGAGLLVSRGMAAWMRAWVEILPSRERTPREAARSDEVLPAAGREEIVTVLAHMALGARQEA